MVNKKVNVIDPINGKPISLKMKKVIFTEKDRINIMHYFHSFYLTVGFASVSQDDFLMLFEKYKQAVPALESLVDKGFIEVIKTAPENYRYKLTRAGLGYFADKQEAAHIQRSGKAWEFIKLLLAALLGAIASQGLEPLVQLIAQLLS